MAAIEKVCEFSGDYPGGKMYDYKHDHIQICPQYRKEFKCASAILWVQRKSDSITIYSKKHLNRACSGSSIQNRYNGQLYMYHRRTKKMEKAIVKYATAFVLQVFDERLAGMENGLYLNYTYNFKKVLRRMKRMLGDYQLVVKYVDDIDSVAP